MSDLRIDVEGPVATLTVDRPAKRNAMTRAMWAAVPGCWRRWWTTCGCCW